LPVLPSKCLIKRLLTNSMSISFACVIY